jgi:hypothetical protein
MLGTGRKILGLSRRCFNAFCQRFIKGHKDLGISRTCYLLTHLFVILGLSAMMSGAYLAFHSNAARSWKKMKADPNVNIWELVMLTDSEIRQHRCDDHLRLGKILVPGVNFIVYVLSHDDASEATAKIWCECRSWARPLRIPESTVYFESTVYRSVLPKIIHEWRHYDYIGLVTYRSIKMLPIEKLQSHIFLAKHGDYDVVPLMNHGFPLMKQAIEGHNEGFKECWDALLTAMGYTQSQIRAADGVEVFLRNSFIIKPKWMRRLIEFMRMAMEITNTNANVSTLMQRDAKYKAGVARVAKRIFRTNYYMWHPFVFERLPVFFFHAHNASVYRTIY